MFHLQTEHLALTAKGLIMRRIAATSRFRFSTAIALLLATPMLAASTAAAASSEPEDLHLPWREAGWTERQAAAHLLDRFAFGALPGDVDRVVEMGLSTWLEQQLAGDLPDPEVDRRLRGFKSLGLSTREMVETYPNPGRVMREATRAGAIEGERLREAPENRRRRGDPEQRRELMDYADAQGYRPQRELIGEMVVQKLARARYSENQLQEVLTDFWFNHFNVSITDNDSRAFVSSYERDAIRPHVLGDFREMLEATAKHPAMLLYLDNARSVAEDGTPTTFDRDRYSRGRGRGGRSASRFGRGTSGDSEARRAIDDRRPQGLNENYARELMELHTLGVDGGYTQEDVVAVARAFTGWATYPPGASREEIDRRIDRARRIPGAGFIFEDAFLFRADAHDAAKKTVLGQTLTAGRGIEDGLEVLDLLVDHPATARHLATKLSARFVADKPPATLVNRLTATFQTSDGDLRQMVRSLAESPEFWSEPARGAKIKSPFELTASTLRILNVEVTEPRPLLEWVWRMGQPLYSYQAPTGYPDRAEAWVNTGSLLNRMNFGLQLATRRIPGLEFDLVALNEGHEPESLGDALETYVPLLMPERDAEETIRRLEPVIHDPELAKKIAQAAPVTTVSEAMFESPAGSPFGRPERGRGRRDRRRASTEVDTSPLAQVVGVILGSPEFQRR